MNQQEQFSLSTPLSWALAYAEIGWHVLPLEPRLKTPLGRLVPRGMLDATTDLQVIRSWWMRSPDAGVGIALAQSGLVAIDIDPRNGGTETFEQLQAAHGSLRSEVMAMTGGGGEHHVFVVPPGTQISLPVTLGRGVDLKANGYIVAEPSIHPSGRQYVWEASSSPLDGVAPSPLPDWLRSLRHSLPAVQAQPGDKPVNAQQAKDAREALYVISPEGYDEWVHAGMALHATGWGHPAYAMWCAWSQQSAKFDATECRRKWDSFTADESRSTPGITLAWVFRHAQALGWQNPASGLTAAPEAPSAGLPLLSLAELRQASEAITWSVKHVIPADSVGVLFGGSGTFKSFVALDYALHVAHGLPWLGQKTRRGAVIFIAAEGGAGLWRRVHAWHQARGLKWDGIPFYTVPVAVQLGKHAGRVVVAAQSVGVVPAAVIVDTLSQTFDGEENSANEMAAYLRELGTQFRAIWRCVVMVIHHSGHQATERPRGSSAIRSNVDFMFGCFRDEKEMLATVECVKQKDGEIYSEVTFSLVSERLGTDEDGDAITSLAARHITGNEELLQAVQSEASAGRGGRTAMLLALLQNGMEEKSLRKAFYEESGIADSETRKKAFQRASHAAMKAGWYEVAEGRIIVLRVFK